ncbi:hypothetical protein AVEN_166760-1 [Araneus ventricosus]|uniref:Uncharacterized protein n=1 Tax=Araneus ventricosus TaxID=182803 RepID=A0A4Y2BR13_ARAVE|nr:hypothetical protein AVEN_166760-1 [Araneus ventricosus]
MKKLVRYNVEENSDIEFLSFHLCKHALARIQRYSSYNINLQSISKLQSLSVVNFNLGSFRGSSGTNLGRLIAIPFAPMLAAAYPWNLIKFNMQQRFLKQEDYILRHSKN